MLDTMFSALAGLISGVPRPVLDPGTDAHSAPGGPVPGPDPRKPWTQAQERALYARPNSFTDLLPWREYDAVNKCFVLEDSTSVGAYFELAPVGCEARPDQWMRNLRDNFQNVLHAIPEVDDGYWTLQLYLNDEPSLDGLMDSIRGYVHPRARNTAFTNDYLARMEEHLKSITRPGGLFVDTTTSGAPWRGQMRRVRAVLFRRRGPGRSRSDMTPIMELNDAATRFENALTSAGVGVKRCGGREFYRFLLAWFNPRTPIDDLMAMAPYPGDHPGDASNDWPHGNDFAEMLLFSRPKSDKETGVWWFDGLPHRTVSVQELRAIPHVGHITAERAMGDYAYAMFDRVPEGATACMSITLRPRDATLAKIDAVYRKSKGDTADAEMARAECDAARRNIANGNVLYPVEMVWYLRGQDEKDLRHQVGLLKAMLLTNNLQVIDELGDTISTDTYIRNLPMKYDPALDLSAWTRRRRSRSWYVKHIANMLPLYGRSTGTGHPGFVAFSRSAEPLTFDPLNKRDRAKNAFMLMLGPPGSGKSATAIKMLLHYMAILRPRLFLIEAGNSFGLFGEHCRKHGLTVNHVRLMPGVDVSLPPFSEALKLLDTGVLDPSIGLDDDDKESPADEEVEPRDYLGEMEISARLMITGGEKKEDDRMTRADRMGIRRAIIEAARAVDAEGRKCVIVMDVVKAMRRVAEEEKGGRPERLREMADGMEMFCSGLAGEFFNREGTRWPNADVTIVDMGILAREGYEDQLAVAVVGLMNAINDLAEREQHDDRPTIVPIDEAHIITTNPLLAPFVVKMAKMWRKLGCWLWLITQNLADFPDASRKMLNMLEWWICLVMPKDEVEQIARFRSLTDEQRALLLAPRKEPGKYTEGVVMSDKVQALFRVVSTPLALALAQTEKHEKADRARIMTERGCTELEAAYVIAERIGKSR